MIIIDQFEGRLANWLFSYVYYYAYCLENDIFLNMTLPSEWAKYFKHFHKKNRLLNYFNLKWHKSLRKILRFLSNYQLFKIKYINGECSEEYLKSDDFLYYSKHGIILLNTSITPFSDRKMYHKGLVEKFMICDKYNIKLQKLLESYRKNTDVLVGVHIRHTDYATWNDGVYYFDTAIYAKQMTKLCELLPDKKIRFVVCTDDVSIKLDDFKDYDLQVILSKETAVIDLYTLAGCDYIISTASTFAMWASFYGQTPCFMILPERKCLSELSDFGIC